MEKKCHSSEKQINTLFEMVKNLSDKMSCDEEQNKKKKARVKPKDTTEVILSFFFQFIT